VVRHLRARARAYIESVTDDPEGEEGGLACRRGRRRGRERPALDQAIALVARERKCSVSFVQRYLQIGYNRAARIVERMKRKASSAAPNHVGKREVLARDIDDRTRLVRVGRVSASRPLVEADVEASRKLMLHVMAARDVRLDSSYPRSQSCRGDLAADSQCGLVEKSRPASVRRP